MTGKYRHKTTSVTLINYHFFGFLKDGKMFRLKGYTSRVLRQEFPHLLKLPSMWTRSYFCSSAGDASSETIKKYIANQNTR